MHKSMLSKRYAIKPIAIEDRRSIEQSAVAKSHPLSYMELAFDTEYSLYNNLMSPDG